MIKISLSIAWGITGAGDYIEETVSIMDRISDECDVEVKVFLSKRQKTTFCRPVCPFKYSMVVLSIISAQRSMGKPKIPALIAGKEILLRLFSSANFSEFNVAFLSFSFSLPSPILGPTA